MNSRHQVAGQGHQHRGARKNELPQHVSHALPATFAMARSRTQDGRWAHTQRHHVW